MRRRPRRPDDGLAVPMQVQLLEADMLDGSRNGDLAGGGRIVPKEPAARFAALTLQALCDGLMDASLNALFLVQDDIVHTGWNLPSVRALAMMPARSSLSIW